MKLKINNRALVPRNKIFFSGPVPRNRIFFSGFTLIELLVTIAIIGTLATMAFVYLGGVRFKAGDTKRKADLNQIGRFLSFGCFSPDAGDGAYDLTEIINELKTRYPQYAKSTPSTIKDPKTGTAAASNYKYTVTDGGAHCVLYANLENDAEKVTLTDISAPTPDGRSGVFEAASAGWNGTKKYYQISR